MARKGRKSQVSLVGETMRVPFAPAVCITLGIGGPLTDVRPFLRGSHAVVFLQSFMEIDTLPSEIPMQVWSTSHQRSKLPSSIRKFHPVMSPDWHTLPLCQMVARFSIQPHYRRSQPTYPTHWPPHSHPIHCKFGTTSKAANKISNGEI